MNNAEIILCNAYNLKYVVGNAPTDKKFTPYGIAPGGDTKLDT